MPAAPWRGTRRRHRRKLTSSNSPISRAKRDRWWRTGSGSTSTASKSRRVSTWPRRSSTGADSTRIPASWPANATLSETGETHEELHPGRRGDDLCRAGERDIRRAAHDWRHPRRTDGQRLGRGELRGPGRRRHQLHQGGIAGLGTGRIHLLERHGVHAVSYTHLRAHETG